MSTRGLVSVRNNAGLIEGRYHHSDSYYDSCGKEAIDIYFNEEIKDKGWKILELAEENSEEDSRDFLNDGLFNEFSYIYNQENDTLEIYRGFFKKKQAFKPKEQILNSLESNGKETLYCHLIMIIDRKKHTHEQVLKAFEEYNKATQSEDEYEETNPYPEHKVIPLEIPKNYVQLVTGGYETK